MTMTIEECARHIPITLTPEMERFATEEALRGSRYIFTTREGGHQWGYCTHCKFSFRTHGLKHHEQATCPECRSSCTVKASGKGRKKMIDEAFFTYYLMSAIDPNAIVAIGTHAVRDYTGDYMDVKTKYAAKSLYVFRPGGGAAFHRLTYYDREDGIIWVSKFVPAKTVRDRFYVGCNARMAHAESRESIAEAVKNTPFRFSTWEQYYGRLADFFDLYARYPSVEYLTKLGFKDLVIDKINGEKTYGTINWRGSNPLKVLKMTKQDLREIRAKKLTVTYAALRLLQIGRKDGSKLTPLEAVLLSTTYVYGIDDLLELTRYGNVRRITNYLAKQAYRTDCHQARAPYEKPSHALRAWKDYIADCTKLGLDLSQDRVLFPSNLHQAHQNTIAQIKHQADQLIRQKIKAQAKKLAKYRYADGGLFVRPALSQDELIAEGKALHHCVGTYAARYADGKTAIFLIRQKSEPDNPYYTVEVINNRVVQCYGLKNCRPDETVQAFVDHFSAAKLQPKQRQEVAL